MTMRDKAELLRVIGHPTRLAIIERLACGPRCVTDIQDLLGMPQANISQHLMALRSVRVVDYHEEGKLRCYYVARPKLAKLVLQFLADGCPVVERTKEEVRKASKRKAAAVACAGSQ